MKYMQYLAIGETVNSYRANSSDTIAEILVKLLAQVDSDSIDHVIGLLRLMYYIGIEVSRYMG